MKKTIVGVAFALAACPCVLVHAEGVRDAMRGPELKDVRLGGYPSEKMDALFEARMLSKHAQRDVFGEARRAFEALVMSPAVNSSVIARKEHARNLAA